MANLQDVMVGPDGSDVISLSKLVGAKIVDIHGYICDPYGGLPLFQITGVFFENGTHVWVEGEHDCAFIPGEEFDGGLEDLYHQQQVRDGEVDE